MRRRPVERSGERQYALTSCRHVLTRRGVALLEEERLLARLQKEVGAAHFIIVAFPCVRVYGMVLCNVAQRYFFKNRRWAQSKVKTQRLVEGC